MSACKHYFDLRVAAICSVGDGDLSLHNEPNACSISLLASVFVVTASFEMKCRGTRVDCGLT